MITWTNGRIRGSWGLGVGNGFACPNWLSIACVKLQKRKVRAEEMAGAYTLNRFDKANGIYRGHGSRPNSPLEGNIHASDDGRLSIWTGGAWAKMKQMPLEDVEAIATVANTLAASTPSIAVSDGWGVSMTADAVKPKKTEQESLIDNYHQEEGAVYE